MLFTLAILLTACATTRGGESHRLITPESQEVVSDWTADEKTRDFAMRNLRRSDEASFHLLRVAKQRKATVHERSDLVMAVISGRLRVTVDREVIEMVSGDVIEIPRDTPYALTNQAVSASVAYLVYTKALDPADSKPAQTQSKGAWRWNLWAQ
jgi:mannose-6-phosphate isomerase-like protein (cupin superfamily)